MAKISALPQKGLIFLVYCYQYTISPILGPRCRFHPTCSSYAIDALKKHHIFNAFKLIIFRILRCHPLHPGGIDPVPEKQCKLNHGEKLL